MINLNIDLLAMIDLLSMRLKGLISIINKKSDSSICKQVVAICCWMIFSFISCVKDKPNTQTYSVPNSTHRGMLIVNEGAYGNNNAEIYFRDQLLNKTYDRVLYAANGKQPGDVIQSVSLINENYYVAVNGSNKVLVVDSRTFKEVAIVSQVKSPRYITQVSPSKAYISSLYFPLIYVLDVKNHRISGTIQLDHPSSEKMLLVGNKCFITNWDTSSNLMYCVDVFKDSIVDKIVLPGFASHDIVKDKNNMLWILSGNKYKQKASFLSMIDPSNHQIKKTFSFLSDEDPLRLTMNSAGDTLYYINVDYTGSAIHNGVFKMGINQMELPGSAFISANANSYFWGIGIDSVTQHIFIADPKGFTQQSTIYEYTADGQLIDQFPAGIGANGFLFK